MRKVRLYLGNPVVKPILEQDLTATFKEAFLSMFGMVNWGPDDLLERVGFGTALKLANLLGWELPQLQ